MLSGILNPHSGTLHCIGLGRDMLEISSLSSLKESISPNRTRSHSRSRSRSRSHSQNRSFHLRFSYFMQKELPGRNRFTVLLKLDSFICLNSRPKYFVQLHWHLKLEVALILSRILMGLKSSFIFSVHSYLGHHTPQCQTFHKSIHGLLSWWNIMSTAL